MFQNFPCFFFSNRFMTNLKLQNAAQEIVFVVNLFLPQTSINKNIYPDHAQRNWLLTHALHIFYQYMRLLCSFSKPGVQKKSRELFFSSFFFGYSPPVTSYSLRGLLFICNSYWDLLSVTVFNIISYEIMAKYFQNFAKRDTFQFGRRFFFLPRNGVISSDNGG